MEKDISESDYNAFFKVTKSRLNKIRYVLEGKWEVDFFKNGKDNYFVMAEIEMPEGQKNPESIHPLVSRNLLYKVKRGDNRFSSKKLADLNYTKRMLNKFMLSRTVR